MRNSFAAVNKNRVAVCALLLVFNPLARADADITEISLQELLKLKVTTASRKSESLDESPAFVEIITRDDLIKRGYKDLSFLMDDLSGIQVSRTFGDNYFNTLWRGVRHTIGSSHLILVDGLKFNHLYNNEAEVMAALPLSNIKQVEVVYGPASVAYGSDAVVGIINVITDSSRKSDEDKFSGFIQIGENDVRVMDMHYQSQIENLDFLATLRLDQGDLDFSKVRNYRWTNPDLLTNVDIWGGFYPHYTELSSPHRNHAIDLRLNGQAHRFTALHYRLASGYGLGYTFDHSLPDAGLWIEEDVSLSWQWQSNLTDKMDLKTLVRYRVSDIDNDSFFIEGYLTSDQQSGQTIRVLDASYWESENNSLTASAEINWQLSEQWEVLTGIETEFKDLQKAYNINFGPSLEPQNIQVDNYAFPQPPTTDTVADNHIDTSQ
ncbi:MAG: TonB-dependent receptor plug domain-containing protein, partial [Kangiellaceae bacterium]|nr:TonB-dependent receptor plug domain-containing protein [Kangiellaceae bacterium]